MSGPEDLMRVISKRINSPADKAVFLFRGQRVIATHFSVDSSNPEQFTLTAVLRVIKPASPLDPPIEPFGPANDD